MVSSLICFCVLFVFSIVLIGWQLAESLSFQERPGECRTVSCGSEILSSNELEGWHLSHNISHSAKSCHDIKCTYAINYQPLITIAFFEHQLIFSVTTVPSMIRLTWRGPWSCDFWSDATHVPCACSQRCLICAWSLLALSYSAECCDTSFLVSYCAVLPSFYLLSYIQYILADLFVYHWCTTVSNDAEHDM